VRVLDDAALGFFVGVVAAEGGLSEERAGLVDCLVPEALGRALDLPEAVTVTADPDASREDGALLLAPGHPVIDTAADRVLSAADVGVCHVAAPGGPPPSLESLLPRVREQLVVDHGRVDAGRDAPVAVRLPLLRAGALVTYDVSPDERFHERLEVVVDATTGMALPADLRAAAAQATGPVPNGAAYVLAHDAAAATAAAHHLLEQRCAERLAELTRQHGARAARDQEAARTVAYYREALASLDSRRASATPERRRLLDAQVEAVRAEQGRRLREIDEKFESRFQLRPFRLHLVTVPVLSLPLVVRRGPRAWPLTLTWMTGLARALPLRCPWCGQPSPLVAGKDRLGCRACLPGASLAPVPPAPPPPAAPAAAPASRGVPDPPPPPPPAAAPSRSTGGRRETPPARGARGARAAHGAGAAGAARRPPDVARLGDRLARDLWRVVLSGRRWPRHDLAPGSPLEALVRAYGHRALGVALDVPERLPLEAIHAVTLPSQRRRAEVTTGSVAVLGMRLPFTLRWRLEGSRALPGELLPFGARIPSLAAARSLPPCPHLRAGPPPAQLDAGARAVWRLLGADGLPSLGRGLAAWWQAMEAGCLPAEPDRAAAIVVEAVRSWPPGNVVTEILGGPDWWAQ
jgi:hypothetical protein